MTNYEKILNEMTPEKLAYLFDYSIWSCHMCAYGDNTYCNFHCLEGIREWLKQEAEDEAD